MKQPLNSQSPKRGAARLISMLRTAALTERRFLDYWSLVHLATGFALGLVLAGLHWDFRLAMLATVAALTAWELAEPGLFKLGQRLIPGFHPFRETLTNQATDVVVGAVGFVVGWVV